MTLLHSTCVAQHQGEVMRAAVEKVLRVYEWEGHRRIGRAGGMFMLLWLLNNYRMLDA